jgi:sugar/nucleoside kinase (ribokinase family)
MNISPTYDVLCIGNYTKDTIISPAGVSHVDGGAVNYAAHAAARLGLKVAVVTHLAREDSRVVDKFTQSHIDCFPIYTPHSTCMRLEYPGLDPDIRTLTVTDTAGSITPDEVEGLSMKTAVIGSSLRGEVGLDVIRLLHRKSTRIALDVQGFVRVLEGQTLKNRPWDEMEATLAYVDMLKSDAVEAESLTGEQDIYKAAQAYARMGAREVVLTHKDGLLIHAGGEFHALQFHPQRLTGRSGRGDTCIGTYAAMRLSRQPREAGIWAAALTSLKMENPGPFARSIQDVEELIRSKYNGRLNGPASATGSAAA